MVEEIKILLGSTANNYSDAQIGICLKMALAEVQAYCNRELDYELEMCAERLAIIKLNRLNTEGLASQSYSGVSESYEDDIPADILRILNRKYIKRLYQQCIVRTTGLLLCEIDDDKFAATGEMIKIYNYTTKTFEQSFSHKDFVSNVCSMLQLKNTILVVSYAQTGLVFYNIYDNKSQPYVIKATAKDIRDGLTNTELCHIDEKRFAACLLNTITILSSNPPYDKLFVLEGHISTIASMIKIKNKNILISASQHKYAVSYSSMMMSDDKKEDTVRIWDLENKNCMKIINDIDCYSKQIVQYDERIAIIGGYEQIILIDFINLKIDAVIEDENIKDLFVYSLLKIDDNNILLGCEKEMKKESVLLGVLDVKNRKIMETQERYLNHISDLIFINKNVIAIGGNSLEIIQKE